MGSSTGSRARSSETSSNRGTVSGDPRQQRPTARSPRPAAASTAWRANRRDHRSDNALAPPVDRDVIARSAGTLVAERPFGTHWASRCRGRSAEEQGAERRRVHGCGIDAVSRAAGTPVSPRARTRARCAGRRGRHASGDLGYPAWVSSQMGEVASCAAAMPVTRGTMFARLRRGLHHGLRTDHRDERGDESRESATPRGGCLSAALGRLDSPSDAAPGHLRSAAWRTTTSGRPEQTSDRHEVIATRS